MKNTTAQRKWIWRGLLLVLMLAMIVPAVLVMTAPKTEAAVPTSRYAVKYNQGTPYTVSNSQGTFYYQNCSTDLGQVWPAGSLNCGVGTYDPTSGVYLISLAPGASVNLTLSNATGNGNGYSWGKYTHVGLYYRTDTLNASYTAQVLGTNGNSSTVNQRQTHADMLIHRQWFSKDGASGSVNGVKLTNTSGGWINFYIAGVMASRVDTACTTHNTTHTMSKEYGVEYTLSTHLSAYEVAVNLNGGAGVANPGRYWFVDSASCTPGTPWRTGYTFNGWWIGSTNYGTSIPFYSTNAPGNIQYATVTAGWTNNTYTVYYDGNGATGGSTGATTHTYDVARNLATNGFTRTGYTFAGWGTSPTSGVVYNNAHWVGNLLTGGSMTLYAQWTPNTYTITYNAGGGTGTIANQTVTYNQAVTISNGTGISREGYTFAGWTTNANGINDGFGWVSGWSGTWLYVNGQYGISGGVLNLYAMWTPNPYTYNIVYKSESGKELGTATVTHNFGTTNTITAPDKTGYTAPEAQNVAWNSVDAKTITFTYTPISYSITYHLDGGTNYAGAPASYTIESAEIIFETPTKAGSTFNGWYAEDTFTNVVTGIPAGSTENVVIYAKWTAGGMTVIYTVVNPNGGTIDRTEEMVQVGVEAQGCTPTAGTGFHFVQWYTDAACTTPVDDAWIVEGNILKPVFTEGVSEATYYAKFGLTLKTIVLTPSLDEGTFKGDPSFIYLVTCDAIAGEEYDGTVTVTVAADGTAYIDLPLGDYSVTEKEGWNWRYTLNGGEAVTGSLTDASDETVTVMLSYTLIDDRWLNSYSPVASLPKTKEYLITLAEDDDGDDDHPGVV